MASILPPTPISPISFTEDILQCSICKKTFKSKRGLSQHKAIIRRYNSSRAVTVACTESQFFATFGGNIHHYSNKSRVHKCIFGGSDASSKLAQVFGDTNWGTKFYHGNEVTSVVTNLDDIDTEEENPLDRKRKFKIYSQRNPRYKRGQVIIEWKPRREKDVKSNKCEGGFLHIHFWVTKKRIMDH